MPRKGHGAVPWERMLRSPSVWSLCMMYGFLGFSGNFYLTLLPTYLKNHRHLDSQTAGLLTSLPFAFGVAACFLGGWFSDAVIRRWGKRWGRRIVGATGLSLAGLSIVAVPWVEGVVPLGFLLVLTFFGNDLAMAPAWAAAADIGERHAGVLSGAMNMIASFMAAIEALIIGRSSTRTTSSRRSSSWPPATRWEPCAGSGLTCGRRWAIRNECAGRAEPTGCTDAPIAQSLLKCDRGFG